MDKTKETIFNIREGMDVFDASGDKIGTVDFIRFGDEDPMDPGNETITGSDVQTPEQLDWVESLANVLRPETKLTEEMRARMKRFGYLKIEKGILQSDQFATLDEVKSIANDEVHLKIEQDDMLKA